MESYWRSVILHHTRATARAHSR